MFNNKFWGFAAFFSMLMAMISGMRMGKRRKKPAKAEQEG